MAVMPRPNMRAPPTEELAWKDLTVREADLLKLVGLGLLLEQAISGWKMPGDHRRPAPGKSEIIMWPQFIERELMLPSSNFLRGLLHFYDITLNHLTANSVLQISIFVHLCEAFLGIPPSITLFLYFFWMKAQPSDMRTEVVGGANIQLR